MQAADILTDSVNILRDTNCTRLPFDNSLLYDDYPSESETIVSPYTWMLSLLASSIVGSTGVIPMILIPRDLHSSSKLMRLMLAFAVGGLLGDVFLHLLPEAWSKSHTVADNLVLGLWVVIGLFSFTSLEVFFSAKDESTDKAELISSSSSSSASTSPSSNNNKSQSNTVCPITGYLNVIANGIDNFTHGLAVAGSFMAGHKIGMLTTFAIIIHEVPHEFGDFAILMKSGFSKKEAAKAQISTASFGLLGALTALMFDSIGTKTYWILPFTAGGFLHISLVDILPDIINEDNPVESIKQLFAVASGIAVMALVNMFIH